jgi:hypothetical protein
MSEGYRSSEIYAQETNKQTNTQNNDGKHVLHNLAQNILKVKLWANIISFW